jgi:hypothetical protein
MRAAAEVEEHRVSLRGGHQPVLHRGREPRPRVTDPDLDECVVEGAPAARGAQPACLDLAHLSRGDHRVESFEESFPSPCASFGLRFVGHGAGGYRYIVF